MSRPDEGLIHQWLDGECTPEEVARLEHLVATDPEWAAAVAEARGLIAASSRIVQSLDAVPRAMPSGTTAAPVTVPAKRPRSTSLRETHAFSVKPWMRMAAGLALVAGTAYVLRDQREAPFVPAATLDTPAAPPAAIPEVATRPQVPTDVPPLGPVGTADRAVGAGERGASAGAAAPVLLPQVGAGQPARAAQATVSPAATLPPAPRTVVTAPAAEKILESPNSIALPPEAERARREAEARSRAAADAEAPRRTALEGVVVTGTRSAGAPAAPAPTTATSASVRSPSLLLDGCWRITAPPELVAEFARLALRRQVGDTLVIITRVGDLSALRVADTLRGGLQATRANCPNTP